MSSSIPLRENGDSKPLAVPDPFPRRLVVIDGKVVYLHKGEVFAEWDIEDGPGSPDTYE
jgi:hypothetical protein